MATIVYMPEVLANVTEAAIQNWAIAEGDTIAVGDTLAEVETEKAVVDFAAEQAGVVAKLLAEPGKNIKVGEPIAVLKADGDSDADVRGVIDSIGGAAAAPAAAVEAGAVEAAAGAAVTAAPEANPDATRVTEVAAPAASADAVKPGDRKFASPLARRLAREAGLDTESVEGTGPGGRIVRRDVERALANRGSAPAAQAAPAASAPATGTGLPAHQAVPHSRMRKTIARRLTESKTTVPHYYVSVDCRVDALLALRAEINAAREEKISVNDLVIKAIAKALVAVPAANVMWTDEEMLHFEDASIAVAIATETGLLTPVIRNAASLSLEAVSREARAYAEAAREGKIHPDSLSGGTFTVSNLGMFGVPEFSAILNPPQSGILAVGAAVQQPVVQDGEVVVAQVMRVTLSADHRALDGAVAAQLVKKFQELVEHPVSILI